MLVIIFQLWQKYIKSIVLHVSCITYGKSHLRFDLNVFFKLEYVIYDKICRQPLVPQLWGQEVSAIFQVLKTWMHFLNARLIDTVANTQFILLSKMSLVTQSLFLTSEV